MLTTHKFRSPIQTPPRTPDLYIQRPVISSQAYDIYLKFNMLKMELLVSPPPPALYTVFPMSEQSNSRNFQLLKWRYPTELNVRATRVIFNFLAATLKNKKKQVKLIVIIYFI